MMTNRLALPASIRARHEQYLTIPGGAFTLPPTEFETLWPYMSNIWIKRMQRPLKKGLTRYYSCRLYPEAESEPKVDESARNRKPSSGNARAGPMAMKMLVTDEAITLTLTQGEEHNHDLEELDMTKRCDGVDSIIKAEISQGYASGDVQHNFRQPELAEILEPTAMNYAGM